jgi:hypothetical protein
MRVVWGILLCFLLAGGALGQRGGGGGGRMGGGGGRMGGGGGRMGGGGMMGRPGIGGGGIGRPGFGRPGGGFGGFGRFGPGFRAGFRRGFGRGFGFRGGFWPGYGFGYGGIGYYSDFSDYGLGFGDGYGPGYGYGYPPDYGYPMNQQTSPGVVVVYPPESAPPPAVVYTERANPVMREYDDTGREVRTTPGTPPVYLIAFKDHSIVAAEAYWVDANTLFYVTLQHEQKHIVINDLDRDFTLRLNRERNVPFELSVH